MRILAILIIALIVPEQVWCQKFIKYYFRGDNLSFVVEKSLRKSTDTLAAMPLCCDKSQRIALFKSKDGKNMLQFEWLNEQCIKNSCFQNQSQPGFQCKQLNGKIPCTFCENTGKLYSVVTYWQKNDKYLIMRFKAPASRKNKWQPIVEDMIKSVKCCDN